MNGLKGKFKQPNPELAVRNFAVSLHARASAFAQVPVATQFANQLTVTETATWLKLQKLNKVV